mmetsp:Transcript_97914/g.227042  ORF Transcript_97914/g.227042 Transcript_97914/m.227042 type:complete len:393 (+) Transcript_97914:360-1538(+)
MSDNFLWSAGSMSRALRALATSLSSLTTASTTETRMLAERSSVMTFSVSRHPQLLLKSLPSSARWLCSGDPCKMRLMTTATLLAHRFLSSKRANCLFRVTVAAAAMVLSTKIALMMLNRPIVTKKRKRQQQRLANIPSSLASSSKSGSPSAVLQSPKLQRKTVKIERGTVSKYMVTSFASLCLPKTSIHTRAAMYMNEENRTKTQPSVTIPPRTPLIIGSKCLNFSESRMRMMRVKRMRRKNRNSDAEGVGALCGANNSWPSWTASTMTRSKSNVLENFEHQSFPHTYLQTPPWITTLANSSTKKANEKTPSITIHPMEPSLRSNARPMKIACRQMTTPMTESIISSIAGTLTSCSSFLMRCRNDWRMSARLLSFLPKCSRQHSDSSCSSTL